MYVCTDKEFDVSKVRKLTPELLKQLVLEEKDKLLTDSEKAKEVQAKDFAGTLANHIDYIKALKIKEAKLKRASRVLSSVRRQLKNKVIKEL